MVNKATLKQALAVSVLSSLAVPLLGGVTASAVQMVPPDYGAFDLFAPITHMVSADGMVQAVPTMQVKGNDGELHRVYYARTFNPKNASTAYLAKHYADQNLSAFYRQTYAKDSLEDKDFFVGYSFIP